MSAEAVDAVMAHALADTAAELALLVVVAHATPDLRASVAITEKELARRARMSERNVRRLVPELLRKGQLWRDQPSCGPGHPAEYRIGPTVSRLWRESRREEQHRKADTTSA